ncbi:MAG: type II toxin-antitoxin system RelE/ParE family toxin [Aestuariivita sp.]|nr:type II toxin-antitoxin system RelE/ParE family toxin [Aestuariivita sp.]MCY4202344.1 type II toxin-antitoxin system RelE/ParE family toxin [Aestuariivita sp.]
MTWTIEYAASVHKSVRKLDTKAQRRIRDFLEHRLPIIADPHGLGIPLTWAKHRDLWRYRVGDYRVVVEINDEGRRILILRIAHRWAVYSRLPS